MLTLDNLILFPSYGPYEQHRQCTVVAVAAFCFPSCSPVPRFLSVSSPDAIHFRALRGALLRPKIHVPHTALHVTYPCIVPFLHRPPKVSSINRSASLPSSSSCGCSWFSCTPVCFFHFAAKYPIAPRPPPPPLCLLRCSLSRLASQSSSIITAIAALRVDVCSRRFAQRPPCRPCPANQCRKRAYILQTRHPSVNLPGLANSKTFFSIWKQIPLTFKAWRIN